jgi:hypothetical protein
MTTTEMLSLLGFLALFAFAIILAIRNAGGGG